MSTAEQSSQEGRHVTVACNLTDASHTLQSLDRHKCMYEIEQTIFYRINSLSIEYIMGVVHIFYPELHSISCYSQLNIYIIINS